MGWNTIKIDPADAAFSKWLRLQYRKCQRCGRMGLPNAKGQMIDGLQASHFHGRNKWTTRFDEQNVDCLCAGCHKYFTNHKTEYKEWKRERLGEKAYDLMELRANTTGDRDFKAARLVWRAELRKLEGS